MDERRNHELAGLYRIRAEDAGERGNVGEALTH